MHALAELGDQVVATPVHVGRQPIADTAGRVVGHELLFRSTAASAAAELDGDQAGADRATAQVMLNAFTAFGRDRLLGEDLAFVNLTHTFLVGDLPVPVPAERTVLEILEDIPASDAVLAGARRLLDGGYSLALDDFTWSQSDRVALLPLVTHAKVDITQVGPDRLGSTVGRLKDRGLTVVAERVETEDEWHACVAAGVDLVQGFLVLRPQTLTAVTLEPRQVTCLRLLRRLADPGTTAEELERLILADAALSLRLLLAANSATAGLRRRLGSVRDALVMLGTERVRAWVVLLVASGASNGDAARLDAALVRARTCELLAPSAGLGPTVAFTAGLLSALDVVLGVPSATVLDALDLDPDLDQAVRHGRGPLGAVLALVAHLQGDGSFPGTVPAGVPPSASTTSVRTTSASTTSVRTTPGGTTPVSTTSALRLGSREVAEAYLAALAWSSQVR